MHRYTFRYANKNDDRDYGVDSVMAPSLLEATARATTLVHFLFMGEYEVVSVMLADSMPAEDSAPVLAVSVHMLTVGE